MRGSALLRMAQWAVAVSDYGTCSLFKALGFDFLAEAQDYFLAEAQAAYFSSEQKVERLLS